MKETVNIFFAADDNYLPYMACAIRSIADFASDSYFYNIRVLCQGLNKEKFSKVIPKDKDNISVSTVDVEVSMKGINEKLSVTLRDYYSLAIFYRLFIPSLFPNLKRALYLDCDLVAVSDVAEIYFKNLNGSIIAAVADETIPTEPAFVKYVNGWVGVSEAEYFNSGVMVMDIEKMREERIEEQFIKLISTYNFKTVAPDQDYLNFLCHGKVLYLDGKWNKQPKADCITPMLSGGIVHYNLYNKPWHYEGIPYEDVFWQTAKRTEFYNEIYDGFCNFTDSDRIAEMDGGRRLVEKAEELANMKCGFASLKKSAKSTA